MEEKIAGEEKVVRKEYRYHPEMWAYIAKVMEYAYLAGKIERPTWQDLVTFSLDCAYNYLKQHDMDRRGLK